MRLSKLGYEILDIDGNFDALTISAIKQFQESKGLKADGRVGNITFDQLFLNVGYDVSLSKSYFIGKWKDENSIFELDSDGKMLIRFLTTKIIKNGTWLFENNILVVNMDNRTFKYKLISYNENLFNFQEVVTGNYYQAKRI